MTHLVRTASELTAAAVILQVRFAIEVVVKTSCANSLIVLDDEADNMGMVSEEFGDTYSYS